MTTLDLETDMPIVGIEDLKDVLADLMADPAFVQAALAPGARVIVRVDVPYGVSGS